MEFPYLEKKRFFFPNIDISFEFSRFFFFSFIAKNFAHFLAPSISSMERKYRNRRFVLLLLLWLVKNTDNFCTRLKIIVFVLHKLEKFSKFH